MVPAGDEHRRSGRVPWPLSHREPLRLNLPHVRPGEGFLSGVWWPQSRDLDVELADLVENYPEAGFVTRVLISRPDWATSPQWVPARGGRLKVRSFPDHDTHVLVLSMSDLSTTRLLVVPPDHRRGTELLMLDVTGELPGAAHDLLDEAH